MNAALLFTIMGVSINATHAASPLDDPVREIVSHSQTAPSRGPSDQATGSERRGPYAPDPDHIWNRLYRAFYVRVGPDGQEYGYDELDLLVWRSSEHLLTDSSHEQAVALLDEFLSTNAETLVKQPLKLAILQRDLWAVFDWLTEPFGKHPRQRRELLRRLAQVIQRLALTKNQIRALPDNYAAVAAKGYATRPDASSPGKPYLPPDLMKPDGAWVTLAANGGPPIAPNHLGHFGGRSLFWAFIRLPDGREATREYLSTLHAFPDPWGKVDLERKGVRERMFKHPHGPFFSISESPDLPQFPVGTQVAFLRQMMLIDRDCELVPSPLTEAVQIRVYQAIPTTRSESTPNDQFYYEFKLRRKDLFSGEGGGLHAVGPDECEFCQFQCHDFDPFEKKRPGEPLRRRLILQSCRTCHSAPGVYSFFARSRFVGLPGRPPANLGEFRRDWEERVTIYHKRQQYSWGLLQGLWQHSPER